LHRLIEGRARSREAETLIRFVDKIATSNRSTEKGDISSALQ
jgi:hypothetical protein